MGRYDQKRIIPKIDLQKFLKKIIEHPNPKADLEQYTTPVSIVANILFMIENSNIDIHGKTVLDLGCGTGRFAIGSYYLGAQQVVGIDLDKTAIKMAQETSKRLNLENNIDWIIGDISAVRGHFDTVIQNPPFGIHKRHADRKFLKKALEVGKNVYSIHNHPSFDKKLIKSLRKNSEILIRSPPSSFLKKYVEEYNGKICGVYSMLMTIPRMFNFHKKRKYSFIIDLYWIKKLD